MKRLMLRAVRCRRVRDTRPATFIDHWLTIGHSRRRSLGLSFRYARGLFEWTPFWSALFLGRQDRRPR